VERFLIVVGAGGLGSGARYLVALAAGDKAHQFPKGTLIVNIVGSFLIALVLELALRLKSMPPNLSLALSTGFMGGFTTYSSFNYQTTALAMGGHTGKAAINLIATLVGCVVAGLLGIVLARRLA
jgi:fluoride exporter